MIAAERQDRHLELAAREEGPVVDRVLIEGMELLEAGMHRAGPGIERGIMAPRRLGEPRRIGRKFIPEAIEIDAFAPGDQPLHVRPAEAEMPEQGILQYLLPRPD